MTVRSETTVSDVIAVNWIKPAYEQAADQLREVIFSGWLLPGERLPVVDQLYGTFGISRSTVREVLRSLAAQDLVRTSRSVSGGTFVASTTPGLLGSHLETGLTLLTGTDAIFADELLEARELVESPTARLAAVRTEEHLTEMRDAIEGESRAFGRTARFEVNIAFHTLVLSAVRNKLVEVMTLSTFSVIRTYFLRDDLPARFWSEVETDHRAIIEHIAAQDGNARAQAMRAHIQDSERSTQLVTRHERSARRRSHMSLQKEMSDV